MARVALLGLGALGAANLVQMLDHNPAADVVVVAGGSRGERLRRDGIVANDRHYGVTVADPAAAGPVDLVLVAVKSYQLDAAIADLAGCVGPGTAIVSLLNGTTSERRLQAAFPAAFVPLAISMGSNCGRDATGFRFYSVGRLFVGEPRNDPPSARVTALSALLDEFGVVHTVPADMEHQLWKKFVLNCGVNQATALLEAPYRAIQAPDSAARGLMVGLLREALAAGQARGVDLTEADLTSILEILDALDPAGYSSMAQDAINHRPMETDEFAGEVVRLGEAHGVPTPLSAAAATILQAKEETWA
ncbi:MAG: ketopantoate reductase family protein [Propionibacteriaceae bacterium]|jgi:2-dehydropantoate 2-reductase|nr:ketopantoate reductase family protein [Propionibacteriaceae bacterium]